jgi:hypothetical protein
MFSTAAVIFFFWLSFHDISPTTTDFSWRILWRLKWYWFDYIVDHHHLVYDNWRKRSFYFDFSFSAIVSKLSPFQTKKDVCVLI